MRSETILITGATGFVGRHLAVVAAQTMKDARIIGIGRRPALVGCPVETPDLTSASAVSDVIARFQPGVIFHLAAAPTEPTWAGQYQANVVPAMHILEAVARHQLNTRIVLMGSAAEYGRVSEADLPLHEECALSPATLYGMSKAFQTMAAKYYAASGICVSVARVFNLIGSGMPQYLAIGAFAAQLELLFHARPPLRLLVGNLGAKRDYLDVRDACQALIALSASAKPGQVYNVCSGRSVSMREVLTRMIACSGVDVQIVTDPARVRDHDLPNIYGSYAKLAAVSGWQPTISLDAAIKDMMSQTLGSAALSFGGVS
jgi:GDP-4-dehydro-6-deoxy-D-mannose reductase